MCDFARMRGGSIIIILFMWWFERENREMGGEGIEG